LYLLRQVFFFGSFFIDLRADLPKAFESLITEPISINTFAFLIIVGMVLLAAVTGFGTKEIRDDSKAAHVALAFVRSGLSAGAIAAGSLVGTTFALLVITRGAQGSKLANTAEQFPLITLNLIALIYPMYLLAEVLLDPKDEKKLYIGVLTGTYIVIATASLFFAHNHMMLAAVVTLLFCVMAYGLLHRARADR
jgi:hypothetical protein